MNNNNSKPSQAQAKQPLPAKLKLRALVQKVMPPDETNASKAWFSLLDEIKAKMLTDIIDTLINPELKITTKEDPPKDSFIKVENNRIVKIYISPDEKIKYNINDEQIKNLENLPVFDFLNKLTEIKQNTNQPQGGGKSGKCVIISGILGSFIAGSALFCVAGPAGAVAGAVAGPLLLTEVISDVICGGESPNWTRLKTSETIDGRKRIIYKNKLTKEKAYKKINKLTKKYEYIKI
jgi:hypothetical protein